MARPLRVEVANGLYHLIARGNERKAIYRDTADRNCFLEILRATVERFRWRCLAYCLMTNHYHLLVRTPEPNLARGMRDLNGVYAQAFNRRHGRDGHLFQGHYRALLIESDEHLLASIAYVVRNPVRARLCQTPSGWGWSSQRAALGDRPPGMFALDELLGYFAPTREQARTRYRALTESEAADDPAPYADGVIYGGEEYARFELERADAKGSPEIPSALRPPRRPLDDLLADGPSTISRRLARRRAHIKT